MHAPQTRTVLQTSPTLPRCNFFVLLLQHEGNWIIYNFFISIFLHYMAKGYRTFEIKVYATMSMLLQLYRRRLYSLRRPSGKKLFLKDIKANR